MKISGQSGMVPISPMPQKVREQAPEQSPKRVEQSDVSNAAQLLSRNQSQLEERLAKRQEVINRFSGTLADPVNLHERTIDLIIQRLKNT